MGVDLGISQLYGNSSRQAAALAATQMHAGGSLDFATKKDLVAWMNWVKRNATYSMYNRMMAKVMMADVNVPLGREVPGGKNLRCATWGPASWEHYWGCLTSDSTNQLRDARPCPSAPAAPAFALH